MNFNKQVLFLLIAALFMSACGDDDDTTPVTETSYNNGVLIVNEGAFNSGDGSISHYNVDERVVTQELFQLQNDDIKLGDVIQSVYEYEGKVYIIINNSNRVDVVDANTFKHVGSIDIVQPRYFMPVSADKAYISQWGDDPSTDGAVVAVDLNDYSIIETIPCGTGTEQMIVKSDKLYVANSGYWPTLDSTICIIDINTNAVLNKVNVDSPNPLSFQMDMDDNIWLLSRGDYDVANSGSLKRLNDDGVFEYALLESAGISNLKSNSAKNIFYYTNGAQVNKLDLSAGTLAPESIIDKSFYGLRIDPNNGNIYGADAKGFVGDGAVYIYNDSATLIDSFDVKVFPNGFWFY